MERTVAADEEGAEEGVEGGGGNAERPLKLEMVRLPPFLPAKLLLLLLLLLLEGPLLLLSPPTELAPPLHEDEGVRSGGLSN